MQQVIQINGSSVGRVIGVKGATIRELQSCYGVSIKISKHDNSDGTKDVEISGNDDDIANAIVAINEKSNYDGSRNRRNNYSNDSYKSHDNKQNNYRNDRDNNSHRNDRDNTFYRNERDNNSHRNDRDNNSHRNDWDNNSHRDYDNNRSAATESEPATIDWAQANLDAIEARKNKWSKYPQVKKDFYKEHSEVTNMTPQEVENFRLENNNIVIKQTFEKSAETIHIPNPVWKFEHCFAEYPELLAQIELQGFEKPSPIQCQAWPVLLQGSDLIGIAQTGTGKTLAFLLPALIHIDGQSVPRDERGGPTVLVLAPTRELAIQIEKEVVKYEYRGIRAVCLYGGNDRKVQISKIESGVEIIIATPGRLNDLVAAGYVQLETVTYLILDEADRMLDMGFEPQIRKLLLHIRDERQTVMTSATWPAGVQRLASNYMANPLQVFIGSLDLTAVHSVTQIIDIMDEEDKYHKILKFVQNMDDLDKIIIFCGKKDRADSLSSEFALAKIPCQSIHGNREQSDREQALDDIKNNRVKILVATDVASRGIDIEDITHVINYDFPRNIEEYVHRVGRTGRAGRTGTSISYFTRENWGSAHELIKILEEATQEIPEELENMAARFRAKKERETNERSNVGFRDKRSRFNMNY